MGEGGGMSRGGSDSKVGRGRKVGKGGREGDRCGSHNLFREWRRDSAIHTHKEKGWVAKRGELRCCRGVEGENRGEIGGDGIILRFWRRGGWKRKRGKEFKEAVEKMQSLLCVVFGAFDLC